MEGISQAARASSGAFIVCAPGAGRWSNTLPERHASRPSFSTAAAPMDRRPGASTLAPKARSHPWRPSGQLRGRPSDRGSPEPHPCWCPCFWCRPRPAACMEFPHRRHLQIHQRLWLAAAGGVGVWPGRIRPGRGERLRLRAPPHLRRKVGPPTNHCPLPSHPPAPLMLVRHASSPGRGPGVRRKAQHCTACRRAGHPGTAALPLPVAATLLPPTH